jgi:hypothetical protein
MIYKIFYGPGDWQVSETGQRCELIEIDAPDSEESQSMGFTHFSSIQKATKAWGLTPWVKEKIESE